MSSSANSEQRDGGRRRIDGSTHLYAAGQAVRLKNAVLSSGSVYRITSSLPASDGASPQYRIRNEAENFERMAQEHDLEPVSAATREGGEVKNLYAAARKR